MGTTSMHGELPHVVIVGGGFAGLEMVKKLKNKPCRVTLLDKNNYFTFQPLLYQVASGGLGPDAIAYPLRKLVNRSAQNVRFRMAEVRAVDPQKKELETSIGAVAYDYLVIATGSVTNFFGNKELEQHCMELKSIPQALDIRSDLLQEFERALNVKERREQEFYLNFVIVGAGPTGVETAGALAEFKRNVIPRDYPDLDPAVMQVHLVEAGPAVLPALHANNGQKAQKFLEELGVKVWLNTAVKSYDGTKATLSDGTVLYTSNMLWSAGVKGVVLPGLPESSVVRGNRLQVDEYNKLQGAESIYVVGDVAYMTEPAYPNGHPMVASVAQQQGRLLADNLLRAFRGQAWKPFRYFDKGSMATIGRRRAVVQIAGLRFQGFFAWFVWMFVHLMLLVGYRNRVIVFVNWMWSYLTYDRAIRLIVRYQNKAASRS